MAFRSSFAVLLVVGVVSLLAATGKGMRWPTNLLLFVIFEYVSIVPHELAHAAGAMLTGMDLFRIRFGTGRRWGHLSVAETLIEFRALPVCGSVSAASLNMRNWRFRRIVFVAAGPASNVALCLGAVCMAGGWQRLLAVDWTEHVAPWLMFALANAVLALSSLLRRRRGIQGIPSDGVALFRLLFKPLRSLTQRQLSYFIAKAEAMLTARRYEQLDTLVSDFRYVLSSLDFLQWRGMVDAERGHYDTARAGLLDALAQHPRPGVGRANALNAIAWYDLINGASELLLDADNFSAEAYSLVPWDHAIQSTRGWALVEAGDIDAGTAMLRRSLRGAVYKHDRATILCTLTIAEARRGRRRRAVELLQRARRMDGRCALLARAQRELDAKPSQFQIISPGSNGVAMS